MLALFITYQKKKKKIDAGIMKLLILLAMAMRQGLLALKD